MSGSLVRWEVLEFKRGLGRPHTNWRSTFKDVQDGKHRCQLITAQDGARVWPNASTKMRVEYGSRSIYTMGHKNVPLYFGLQLSFFFTNFNTSCPNGNRRNTQQCT